MTRTSLPVVETATCCSDLRDLMPADRAESVAARFKALADPTRVQLLALVAGAGAGEACVCDLTDAIGLSQPTISHHLSILVKAGLLTRERRGTWAWFAIAADGLAAMRDDLMLG